MIVISVIVVVIVFIVASVFTYIVIDRVLKMIEEMKMHRVKEYSVFDIKWSNAKFIRSEVRGNVLTTKVIGFNGDEELSELGVGEEWMDIMCVGNKSNSTVRVQLSMKSDNYKYLLRVEPSNVKLRRGKGVEMRVYITPLCTCTIHDRMKMTIQDMKSGQMSEVCIEIDAKAR